MGPQAVHCKLQWVYISWAIRYLLRVLHFWAVALVLCKKTPCCGVNTVV